MEDDVQKVKMAKSNSHIVSSDGVEICNGALAPGSRSVQNTREHRSTLVAVWREGSESGKQGGVF